MSSPRTAELAADPRVRRGLEAQLAERERMLAAGAEPLGWKLGFGSPSAMEKLGTAAPLIGFLTSRSIVEGDAVSVAGWTKPLLEPEIAVRVGTGEAGSLTAASFAAAFELADLDPPPEEVERILAGNVFHRRVILGDEVPAGDVDLDSVGAVVTINRERTKVADPQAATGKVTDLIEHVGELLESVGAELRDGEIVICGSLVPPVPVAPGDKAHYELDRVGGISVAIRGASGDQ